MDAWLERMQPNGGIIPSFVDLDGRIGGAEGRWWGNAYGWGFSPVNPVTGQREDRNRIPRALVGFSNALLVTGDQKYVDAWRAMIDAVNAHARDVERTEASTRRCTAPTAGTGGGAEPWRVGALEVWYWSHARRRIARASATTRGWRSWTARTPRYPGDGAAARSRTASRGALAAMRADRTPPDKRLADNMLDYNPAATDALVRLMLGALVPGREGGLLNARLRYFDPARKRAGVPEDVAALVSALGDHAHRRDARQRQPVDRAHGRRAGGRVRRAPDRIGRRRTGGPCRSAPATSPCSLPRGPARRSPSRCAATPTRRPPPFPGIADVTERALRIKHRRRRTPTPGDR